jgi:hypothetical protein
VVYKGGIAVLVVVARAVALRPIADAGSHLLLQHSSGSAPHLGVTFAKGGRAGTFVEGGGSTISTSESESTGIVQKRHKVREGRTDREKGRVQGEIGTRDTWLQATRTSAARFYYPRRANHHLLQCRSRLHVCRIQGDLGDVAMLVQLAHACPRESLAREPR